MGDRSPNRPTDFGSSTHYPAERHPWLRVTRGRAGHLVDRWIVQWTGRSALSWLWAPRLPGRPLNRPLLLETRGRRTGKRRRTVVPYVRRGSSLVVCATNGGGPRDPDWVWNLRADPDCRIWERTRWQSAAAELQTGNAELLDQLEDDFLFLHRYRQLAAGHRRELPVVLLSFTPAVVE